MKFTFLKSCQCKIISEEKENEITFVEYKLLYEVNVNSFPKYSDQDSEFL